MSSIEILSSQFTNAGRVQHPDIYSPEHADVLANIATISDENHRRDQAAAYGGSLFDSENAQLKGQLEKIAVTVEPFSQFGHGTADRHTSRHAASPLTTSVHSEKVAVRRHWSQTLMAVIAVFVVGLIAMSAELKTLAQVIFVSGRLGLSPDSLVDQLTAHGLAFTAAILFAWFKWSRFTGFEDALPRAEILARTTKIANIAIIALIICFALLFGPSLLQSAIQDGLISPQAQASWPEKLLNKTGVTLDDILAVSFLMVTPIAISHVLASIWMSNSEAHARTLELHVRTHETLRFHEAEVNRISHDLIETNLSAGRVTGQINEIESARNAFIIRVVSSVEVHHAIGNQSRQATILDRVKSKDNVITLGK